jgi:membrane-associated phospholipid phosphatase
VVIVFCTTIYTGFHWLTDSVAGALLGLVLARLIERVPWDSVPLPRLRGWERPVGFTPASDRPASPA